MNCVDFDGHSGQIRVHPRVCGERKLIKARIINGDGSSPRVRGTDDDVVPVEVLDRFIPACAGNGVRGMRPGRVSAVHPRVCGERRFMLASKSPPVGSSPRVRGTANSRRGGSASGRFIPACAGNGSARSLSMGVPTVHPRVCGERSVGCSARMKSAGSSPRVRGTVSFQVSIDEALRFIPACAGNGGGPSGAAERGSVHPRVCGERHARTTGANLMPGSSPRVRGTAYVANDGRYWRRFIPACAGNGTTSAIQLEISTVHPRVCGER